MKLCVITFSTSSSPAAMEEYDKMISEMNDAGLEDVEKVITQNYQERMKLWNE
jgi:putative aldouronate transport system substrate-binding protein